MRNQLNSAQVLAGVYVYRSDGHLDALEASVYAYGPLHPKVGLHLGPLLLTLSPDAAAELARCLDEALAALEGKGGEQ